MHDSFFCPAEGLLYLHPYDCAERRHRCPEAQGQRPLTPSPRALTLAGMQLTQDEITRLSPRERLSLIEQLWESLSDADIPLTPAQQAEVERRLATFEHDRAQAVTWDSLKAELARRCP